MTEYIHLPLWFYFALISSVLSDILQEEGNWTEDKNLSEKIQENIFTTKSWILAKIFIDIFNLNFLQLF